MSQKLNQKAKNSYTLNGPLGHNYRVATPCTFYLTVSGTIIPSLKSIGQFGHN